MAKEDRRATTTSRWNGCTRCTPAASTTSSSSTRRRRGTRSTSSRRPPAWPSSSAGGCCAGSPCPTASAVGAAGACSTPPASPSTRWPIASSGASSCRTSPSSSSTSSRCTGGFVERARSGRAAAARPAHHVRGRHHARRRAAPRGRDVLSRAQHAQLRPRCAGAQQGAPRVPVSADGERAADVLRVRGRDRGGARGDWRSPGSTTRLDSARARTVAESFRNYEVVAEREAELRDRARTVARSEVVVRRARVLRRHRRQRRVGTHR